jgi:hypothetical protein
VKYKPPLDCITKSHPCCIVIRELTDYTASGAFMVEPDNNQCAKSLPLASVNA